MWLLCDDAECFVSPFPDIPMNVYIAFYRYGCSAAKASVPNFNMDELDTIAFEKVREMFKPPPIPELNITLDTNEPEGPILKPKLIKPHEGRFAPEPEQTAFLKHLALKLSLLTNKPPLTKRQKKDDDDDYVPSTEDPTDEDELDKMEECHPEPEPKGS